MDTNDFTKSYGDNDPESLAGQTFVPRTPEPEEIPARLRRRVLRSLAGLEDVAKNRYEAVLIASARARQLNAKKMALEERGLEDAAGELKRLKMTSFALNELLDGAIEVRRPVEDLEP